MKELALSIPGFDAIPTPTGLKSTFVDLGSFLSAFFNIIFFIGFFLAFFWGAWGVFHYIFAGGNKEGLASARKRIIWAIVGLVLLLLTFAIKQFTEELIPQQSINIQEVITPQPIK